MSSNLNLKISIPKGKSLQGFSDNVASKIMIKINCMNIRTMKKSHKMCKKSTKNSRVSQYSWRNSKIR